jgi:hypothetical protein
MPDSNNTRVQIVVAIIGLIGVLGTALITNWDRVFPPKKQEAVTAQPPTPSTGATPSKSQPPKKPAAKPLPNTEASISSLPPAVPRVEEAPTQTVDENPTQDQRAASPEKKAKGKRPAMGAMIGGLAGGGKGNEIATRVAGANVEIISASPRSGTLLRRSEPMDLMLYVRYTLASQDTALLLVKPVFYAESTCKGEGTTSPRSERRSVSPGENKSSRVRIRWFPTKGKYKGDDSLLSVVNGSRSITIAAELREDRPGGGAKLFESAPFRQFCYPLSD